MIAILNLITAVMWLCCIVIWSKIIHDNNKRIEKLKQEIDEIEMNLIRTGK